MQRLVEQQLAETTMQAAEITQLHYAWVNGNFLCRVEDVEFSGPGEFTIQANDASFKSIEWFPIDESSEAEALRLLDITPTPPR